MKLVRESVELTILGEGLDINSEGKLGRFLESCGRVCYKSEPKATEDSYKKFLKTIIKSGHESILEHANVTAKIITNRSVTHELVRHRIGVAYSQESTRYCNYSGDRFGSELSFVVPVWVSDEEVSRHFPDEQYDYGYMNNPVRVWVEQMQSCEDEYLRLLQLGWTPEKAREILPNSLATTIMTTFDIRAWRHVLKQRLSRACHPQMRCMMFQVAEKFNEYLPIFFSDIFSGVALLINGTDSIFNEDAIKIIKEDIIIY
jgi:thymidylate synthase (FAD)